MNRIRESIRWSRNFSNGHSVGIIGVHLVPARIQIAVGDINDAETVLAAHSIVVDAVWRQLYGEIDRELDDVEAAIMRVSSLDFGEASEPLMRVRKLRGRIRKLRR